MKNLTVCTASRSIEVSKTFNTRSSCYGTDEYKMLQEVRRDYPGYEVVVVAPRKATKSNKPSYPVIKSWFLDMYPEVKNFGKKVEAVAEEQEEAESQDNVVEIPSQEQEEVIPA